MASKRIGWLLVSVAAGTAAALMVSRLRASAANCRDAEAAIDDAIEDSFPASDPPSFSSPSAAQAGKPAAAM